MKKFVWSETQVEGGQPFTGTLPKPPANTGPFQGLHFVARMGFEQRAGAGAAARVLRDAAVVPTARRGMRRRSPS